jgi:hypothetical protein
VSSRVTVKLFVSISLRPIPAPSFYRVFFVSRHVVPKLISSHCVRTTVSSCTASCPIFVSYSRRHAQTFVSSSLRIRQTHSLSLSLSLFSFDIMPDFTIFITSRPIVIASLPSHVQTAPLRFTHHVQAFVSLFIPSRSSFCALFVAHVATFNFFDYVAPKLYLVFTISHRDSCFFTPLRLNFVSSPTSPRARFLVVAFTLILFTRSLCHVALKR